MQMQINPKRALAAVVLSLLYILMSVWLVRNGRWLPVLGIIWAVSGVLIGLGVALSSRTRKP
jgi:hypothetical protein